MFIKLYCTSTDLKGDVIENLKSNKCKKPKDKSVSDHQDWMEEIMRYSRCLKGTRDDLSEDEIKMILFTLLLVAWQINYKQSQSAIQRTPIEEVIIFMSREKEFSATTTSGQATARSVAVMVVEEEAEVEVAVEAKEEVNVVEVMNNAEHMAVFIFGKIVLATEMVLVTMCWNTNISTTSNTLNILWTFSRHQTRRLLV